MRIPDDDKPLLEKLDDERRRIYDDFNGLVQSMREGAVDDDDRLRLETQQLHVRHQNIIRQMIDMLVYY